MQIFNSQDGDPMLLDTRAGLKQLHDQFSAFLGSEVAHATFPAVVTGDPAPYSEFLNGLRVTIAEGNPQLVIASDRWLELSGSRAELEELRPQLLEEEDGAHNHWYTAPVSLVIEADDSWPGHTGASSRAVRM